jgi:drug/metabolite transporter (DMT)-like permease
LRWALIAVGLAGALLVAQPGGAQSSPYLLLAFVTALASAGRDLLTRKVPDNLPGPVVAFGICKIVFLSTLICSLLFETWQPIKPAHYLYGALAGAFVMAAHLFIFLAFRFATARAVAPFYYSVTFFAVLAGVVFFGEFTNALGVVGMLLIVICGLGVLFVDRKEKTT